MTVVYICVLGMVSGPCPKHTLTRKCLTFMWCSLMLLSSNLYKGVSLIHIVYLVVVLKPYRYRGTVCGLSTRERKMIKLIPCGLEGANKRH